MSDPTEDIRREMVQEINSKDNTRESLEAEYGKVWDTQELTSEFEVEGFMAPFVVVRNRLSGKKGAMQFCHSPRFYFNFKVE